MVVSQQDNVESQHHGIMSIMISRKLEDTDKNSSHKEQWSTYPFLPKHKETFDEQE